MMTTRPASSSAQAIVVAAVRASSFTVRPLFAPIMLIALLALSACTTVDLNVREAPPASKAPAPPAASSTSPTSPASPAAPPAAAAKKPGGYYLDDGPADNIPEGLLDTPDAEPRIEPLARGPSKPYTVFEQTYVPITDNRPFVQRGKGSWYGKKFHGQRTASGEVYDMYKMTAAHPTLPIPSYARVTNLRNGKQVIVRINDRGPFHSSRVIDLSYTAALKLGYLQSGSTELEIERLLPDEILRMQAEKRGKEAVAQSAVPAAGVPADDPIARMAAAGTPASTPSVTTAVTPAITPSVPLTGKPPVAAEIGGFFLQFGAYSQAQNAQAMRARLLSGWPSDLPAPVVVQNGGLYRLHSGPFTNREQASAAAQQLKSVSQIQTAIVQK